MSDHAPIRFRWTGDAFEPIGVRGKAECDALFAIGAVYALEEHQERSSASHAHFFASVAEGWKNLPDDLLEEYPNPETLRKKMLIKGGFRDERTIVCNSAAMAEKVGSFVASMDRYAVVTVKSSVVRVYTPQSQSMRAMGKAEFQKSKEVVLGFIADLIGVEPGTLGGRGNRGKPHEPREFQQGDDRSRHQAGDGPKWCDLLRGRRMRPAVQEIREFHHRLSCRQGGKPTLENAQLLCIPCHDKETALQAPVHAKLRRVEAKHVRPDRPAGNIKSAGFAKSDKKPAIDKSALPKLEPRKLFA